VTFLTEVHSQPVTFSLRLTELLILQPKALFPSSAMCATYAAQLRIDIVSVLAFWPLRPSVAFVAYFPALHWIEAMQALQRRRSVRTYLRCGLCGCSSCCCGSPRRLCRTPWPGSGRTVRDICPIRLWSSTASSHTRRLPACRDTTWNY